MENLFMSASVVITIVICLVGIIKSFFVKFKEKYPNTEFYGSNNTAFLTRLR